MTVLELPPTAIYKLEYRPTANDPWTRIGHLVVNGGGNYKSSSGHEYPGGDESWWQRSGNFDSALSGAQAVRLVVYDVASSLKDMSSEIDDLENDSTWRFDTPYALTKDDWTQVGSQTVSGYVFEGTDPNNVTLEPAFVVSNNVLTNVVWYAASIPSGPYFGGSVSKGDESVLSPISSSDPDWPDSSYYYHASV